MRFTFTALFAIALCAAPGSGFAQTAPAAKAKSAKKQPAGKKGAKPPPVEDKPAEEPAAGSATTAPAAAPAVETRSPAVKDSGAATAPVTPPDAPTAKEEVVTDFDEEEKKLDKRIEKEVGPVAQPPAGGPGKPGDPFAGALGVKLVADLLVEYQVGSRSISFFPNHTLVILMLNVTDRFSAQIHIAPDPAFYELAFAATPSFTIKAGKILVPFGTNNFHHIIGGRVDQQSHFLPETWGDYGIAINHLLLDFKFFSLEYDFYVLNGFGGTTEPVIATGALIDNNFGKGLGGRITFGFPFGIRLITSVYHSLWSPENDRGALYYAVGAALPMGAIRLPVLDRIGLRGEWSRGELQHLDNGDNLQQGFTPHAVAKAGWYGEFSFRVVDLLSLRLRVGRLNPDNTISDNNDVEVYEPAIIYGTPKLSLLAAWQFTKYPHRPYSITSPADVIYAKLFVQY